MGLVGAYGEGRPGNNKNAAKIGIFVVFVLVAAGVSVALYFALRASGSPPATYAAYKLVDPPSSLAASGAILLPMMDPGPAAALWWLYTKDQTSIGLVPKSGGGWRLVRFDPKGGANAVPVACSAWAESAPVPNASAAPPVTAGAWKPVGDPLVSVVGLAEDDLAKFKLDEEPTKVAAVNAARPFGACLRDATPPAFNVGAGADAALLPLTKYDSYTLVSPPGPLSFAHGQILQPMIEPPSGAVSVQRAVWWEYTVPPGSEYASIAVVKAPTGAWKLVAFVALPSAKCEEWAESTAIDGPWTFNAVPLRAFKLERTAAANAATKPLPLLGACPPATLPALLVMSSRLPVLASALAVPNLVPFRGAGATVRWASNHGGTGTCVYVIDLEKEPSFRAGLAAGLSAGPVRATWGLFLYSSTSQQYRGLAYSTLTTQQPPPNIDGAWVSPWTSPVVTIPHGLLGIEMGATVAQHAGIATFPAFREGPRGLWQTPIRLPPLTETTTFGGATYTLGSYVWAPTTAPTTKPESDLTTYTSKYTPELYGSGVRWWLKGETTDDLSGTRTYPDVYVQQWSSSAVEDQPALERISTPASAKWVVYSSLPPRADAAAAPGLAPAVLALVAWSVGGGDSGVPPAGRVWSCTDPQGLKSSRTLPFELTLVGQATVEAAAAVSSSPPAPPPVSTGSSPPPSIEPSPAGVALVYPLELSANSPSAPLLGLSADPTGSSQVGQVVFAAKRATKGGVSTVWWVAPTRGANRRFARIAVMPEIVPTDTVLGMWQLAGIDDRGACTSLAVGFDAAVGTPGPQGASWTVLNQEGQGPNIAFDVRKSQTSVVPAEEPLPVCALGLAGVNPYTSTPAVEQVPPSPPPPAPDVVTPSPPPTSGGVYPLELPWSAAGKAARELLAAPSNPTLDGAAVVFSAMIDADTGATPRVWWVAAASSGTRFTRIAVIPWQPTGTWLLVGESDAAAVIDVWTILAACDGVAGRSTPQGASWRAFNSGSDAKPPIVFPLSDRTSNGVVIPIPGAIPGHPFGLTYGDARTNPFTRLVVG